MIRAYTIFILLLLVNIDALSQGNAKVKEYHQVFTTYPYSDPDPIPRLDSMRIFGSIYPYYRFDGYARQGRLQEWKVVELENDFIKILILPEIGGKVLTAIEKSTGKSFIYHNEVIKFRDVAVRGPWTSGGFEFNFGIYGHSPHCSSPVDFTTIERKDGSVSCVIGTLNLLTRAYWSVDINLPKDKAYFSTKTFWHNANPIEQPYYCWTNVGVKAQGNLQFIFPGAGRIEHNGLVSSWPINKHNNRDISYYQNNNFGGYKSYHVFETHSDFFGTYWHDDDLGMGQFSARDDKLGKKVWIWGLSEQGMLWEKLLTDNNGQYAEVQSGRLLIQNWPESKLSPFKHFGFLPGTTESWTEYWFPVIKTDGFVTANNYGALNLKYDDKTLHLYFSPVQSIKDTLTVLIGDKIRYTKSLSLKPLELYQDSILLTGSENKILISIGDKIKYSTTKNNTLSRPTELPNDFDWNSNLGLHLQSKEYFYQRRYLLAQEKLEACLKKDPYYLPALVDMSMLLFQRMKYSEALDMARKALSINTYDGGANYYYGLINTKLGNISDAKDGFEMASLSMQYRSISWSMLSVLYLKEMDLKRAISYAKKSINFNQYTVNSYQLLAISYRLLGDKANADLILDSLLAHNPNCHFARFERFLSEDSERNKKFFLELVRGEMPLEIFLELATWYNSVGRKEEAIRLLEMAPRNAEISYWLAYLTGKPLNASDLKPDFVFPFRQETAEVLIHLIPKVNHWLLKYHLALIHWNLQNMSDADRFFAECGNLSDYAPFYSARSQFLLANNATGKGILADLKHAVKLDPGQWRYGRQLVTYYLSHQIYDEALIVAEHYFLRSPENYYLGLLYAKALLKKGLYQKASDVLLNLDVLPNEGATEGRKLYKEAQLMLALEAMERQQYGKGLKHIEHARLWPENLGVGKPYASDIDERLENWLTYKCYSALGDIKSAKLALDNIISFLPQKTAYINTFASANTLISAWAILKQSNKETADQYIKTMRDKGSSKELYKWIVNTFNGVSQTIFENEEPKDEDYRILSAYLKKFTTK